MVVSERLLFQDIAWGGIFMCLVFLIHKNSIALTLNDMPCLATLECVIWNIYMAFYNGYNSSTLFVLRAFEGVAQHQFRVSFQVSELLSFSQKPQPNCVCEVQEMLAMPPSLLFTHIYVYYSFSNVLLRNFCCSLHRFLSGLFCLNEDGWQITRAER